jgi:hypothetical protein
MILEKSYRLPHYNQTIDPNGTQSIGIFGDSYARNSLDGINSKCWNYLLAKKIGVKTYDNYGYGGTSFYYTYNNFLDHHEKYDIVVVAVTDPSRFHSIISLPSLGERKVISTVGVRNIESIITNDKLTNPEKQLLTQIKDWYLVNSLEYVDDVQDLMINESIRLRPDAIIIPCFGTSFSRKMHKQMKLTHLQNLYQMTMIQAKSLGIDLLENKWEENAEAVHCHFTDEMYQVLAELVYNKYVTGEWNWNIPEFIAHEKPLEYYYHKL